jgi:hypothetical protein
VLLLIQVGAALVNSAAGAEKKPTWFDAFRALNQVGLLVNEPVAVATCPLSSHPTQSRFFPSSCSVEPTTIGDPSEKAN